MRVFTSLFVAIAVLLPSIGAADAATYYLNRYEDNEITRYSEPSWNSNKFYDTFIYASPYRSKTHALHPYYRHTYYTRPSKPNPRITRPEFYQYLEDLYYDGALGGNVPPYNTPPSNRAPSSRCYNYSTYSSSQWSPAELRGCK